MTDYVATCLFYCGKLTKHGSDLTGCDEGMPVVVRLRGKGSNSSKPSVGTCFSDFEQFQWGWRLSVSFGNELRRDS